MRAIGSALAIRFKLSRSAAWRKRSPQVSDSANLCLWGSCYPTHSVARATEWMGHGKFLFMRSKTQSTLGRLAALSGLLAERFG